ncbi:MAG: hypothetical protein R3213_09840, partial [Flavobacteriaceae bacterium]|nr:hypothetical protein [Flavobacteriaceae bacterium]
MDATRKSREEFMNEFIERSGDISDLIKLSFNQNLEYNYKAAWILELIARNNLPIFLKHLKIFFNHLGEPTPGKQIRPIAKILEILSDNYLSSNCIDHKNSEQIISYSFQLLLGNYEVAPKVFAMTTVFNFSKEIPWARGELKAILERDYPSQSAGYRARAKKI